jgi:hypothetical protein
MTSERFYGHHISSDCVYYEAKHTLFAVAISTFKLDLAHLTGMYLLAIGAVETLQGLQLLDNEKS